MKKITASILTVMLMLSMVFSSSVFAAEKNQSAWDSFVGLFSAKASSDAVGVEYRGHVQNIGDYPTNGSWIQGPERLGTVGKSLRLEAFWIKLTNAPAGLHIKYEVHVQNRGWMAPVEDGLIAGTEGESLRIEAIRISLVNDAGMASTDYKVNYKGHIQNIGDTAWFTNGQELGTTGSSLRLEALDVQIEKIPSDLTAYEAALAAVTESDYTKASWTAYEAVVAANVMTTADVQSAVDAATAAIIAAQADLATVPVISAMTATAQKTITVTGVNLGSLVAADLAVEGNTVTGVTPSADGTSAVVALGTDLAPETNVIVTATIDGVAKEYTVKYTIAGKTVTIQAATYDNDKANQTLTVLVDGVATTPDYLTLAGYSVSFNAWDTVTDVAASAVLLGNANGNSTGILSNGTANLIISNYNVWVTIAKGSTIVTSDMAAIKVLDLDNNATAISAYTLENTTGTTFVQKSTTLVLGDVAKFRNITVGYGSAAAELTGGFTVESADPTVVSVNAATGVMTATGIGTTNVTITYGQSTKVVALTVKGAARAATKVTPSAASITYIIGGAAVNAMNVTLTDQYGDPMAGVTMTEAGPATATQPIIVVPTAITGPLKATAAPTNENGVSALTLTAANENAETGTVVFKNTKGATIGSFTVKTTTNTSATIQKVEYLGSSENKTNVIDTELTSKSKIVLKVGLYNSSGVYNYDADLTTGTGYRVLFNKNIISVDADTTGEYFCTNTASFELLAATGGEAGSTTLQVFDPTGKLIDTRTITVTKTAPYITAVSFKTVPVIDYATTLNYKTVLNVTNTIDPTTSNPIITGITLSTPSVFPVRIDPTTSTLYLDKDNSTSMTAGEELGILTYTVSSDATGGLTADATGLGYANLVFAAPAKGTVTYTVQDTVSADSPYVATKGIVVNAK